MDWLEEIRQRADKATPGEWGLMHFQSGTVCVALPLGRKLVSYEATPNAFHVQGASPGDLPDNEYHKQRMSDGRFIAHARQDIPNLLAALDKYREALNEIAAWYDGPVVNSMFDEPGAASMARDALSFNPKEATNA